ncbi:MULTISPECIES: IS5 family transposase [unclassified Streptomyces]|uniref:IS5 family transposase n=1 Tax=unclassified Streptomyces TaxID=2593676 RepID=UPI001F4263A4|nr:MULTISPECIES: IS5 family transposase [unclassified Streptomyces]
MIPRGELTDVARARIMPLLPRPDGRRGRWRDLPDRYGPWKICHERPRRWTADGTWDRILTQVQADDDAVGTIEWVVSVDSTTARSYQHGAGARKKGGCGTWPVTPVGGEALGRSRGELSTKVHPAVGGRGRPLPILLTPGQAGEKPQLVPLPEAIRVPRLGPGASPVAAGSGHRRQGILASVSRAQLRRRRIATTIPERADQKSRRRGRPPCFDRDLYHDRNVVERCFNRLKQWRGLATRYAKRAAIYRTEVVIAAIMIWLR